MSALGEVQSVAEKLRNESGWVAINVAAERFEAAAVCALACGLLADDLLALCDQLANWVDASSELEAWRARERLRRGGVPNSTGY